MSNYRFEIPVVLIVFNRPELARAVLAEIRKVKPTKLYIIADGPRLNVSTDVEQCRLTREIISEIDWEVETRLDFAEVNMGCRDRVISGLNFVFAQENCAVILEDDCIPENSFFPFCAELLEKYANDERIMSISGTNYLGDMRLSINSSYYFSLFNMCWGWATWARAWKMLDPKMMVWPEVRNTGFLRHTLGDLLAASTWRYFYDYAYLNKLDTWAFRFQFSSWINNCLSIVPNENLVTNVGFGHSNFTNTWNKRSNLAFLECKPVIFPLTAPKSLMRNWDADAITQRVFFKRHPGWVRKLRRFLRNTFFAKKN